MMDIIHLTHAIFTFRQSVTYIFSQFKHSIINVFKPIINVNINIRSNDVNGFLLIVAWVAMNYK